MADRNLRVALGDLPPVIRRRELAPDDVSVLVIDRHAPMRRDALALRIEQNVGKDRRMADLALGPVAAKDANLAHARPSRFLAQFDVVALDRAVIVSALA